MDEMRLDVCLVQELKLSPSQLEQFNHRTPELTLIAPGQASAHLPQYMHLKSLDVGFLVRRDIEATLVQSSIDKLTILKITKNDNDSLPIHIVNVHGPNRNKAEWWRETHSLLKVINETYPIDFLGGDFNVTLELRDRRPQVALGKGSNELCELLQTFGLVDVFKTKYPQQNDYTFNSNSAKGVTSYARIDRIYCKLPVAAKCGNWITIPVEQCDHSLIFCEITNEIQKTKRNSTPKLNQQAMVLKKPFDLLKKIIQEGDSWRAIVAAVSTQIPFINRLSANIEHTVIKSALLTRSSLLHKKEPTIEIDKEIASLYSANFFMAQKTKQLLESKLGPAYLLICPPPGVYKTKSKEMITSLKSSDTGIVTSVEEMSEIAQSFYQNLYDANVPTTEDMEPTLAALGAEKNKIKLTDSELYCLSNVCRPIDAEELDIAIKGLKPNKSPGPDGIPNEFYKTFKLILIKPLLGEFNAVLLSKTQLTGSKQGTITLLFKKGDKLSLANYRPITLLNTCYKLFTAIIAKRLSEAVAPLIHKSQHAFLPRRKIFDAIYEAQTFLYDRQNKNKVNAALVLLDQAKAYDKTSQLFLYKCLEILRVPQQMIEVIKELYNGFTAKININNNLSDQVRIEQGVKQGDPLSCILFVCVMESLGAILRESSRKDDIVTLFADDCSLNLDNLEVDWPLMQSPLNLYCQASKAVFNASKTEVILVGDKSQNYPQNLPPPIENKQFTMYLGSPLGIDLNFDQIAKEKLNKLLDKARSYSLNGLTIDEKRVVMKTWIYSRMQFTTQCIPIAKDLLKKFDQDIHNLTFKGKNAPWGTLEALTVHKKDGGLGGTNARMITDLAQYNIVGNMIDMHTRELTLWEQRLIDIWISFAAKTVKPTHALRNPKMTLERRREICVNPFLQNIRDVGILHNVWPAVFSEALKQWRGSNAKFDLTRPIDAKTHPFAWSEYLIKQRGGWQNVNQMLINSKIVTWGDLAGFDQTAPLENQNKNPKQMIASTDLQPLTIHKVAEFINLHPASRQIMKLAGCAQTLDPLPLKELVQVSIKRICGKDDERLTFINPFDKNAARSFALARVITPPQKSKQWALFWALNHESKDMEFLYKLLRDILKLGCKMPSSDTINCPHCGVLETRDHLVKQCQSTLPFRRLVESFFNDYLQTDVSKPETQIIKNLTTKFKTDPIKTKQFQIGYAKYLKMLWEIRNRMKYESISLPSTQELCEAWLHVTQTRLHTLNIPTGSYGIFKEKGVYRLSAGTFA